MVYITFIPNCGEMAERLKAQHWKCCLGEILTRVRISLSPPFFLQKNDERRRKSSLHCAVRHNLTSSRGEAALHWFSRYDLLVKMLILFAYEVVPLPLHLWSCSLPRVRMCGFFTALRLSCGFIALIFVFTCDILVWNFIKIGLENGKKQTEIQGEN